MRTPDTTYPITVAEASRLTGVAASTLGTIAARLGLGRSVGNARIRLLSRADLRKILAKKRDKRGRPALTP